MVHVVTEETFESEVLKSDIPVIVDFWAQWCGPCKMMAPIFEDLSKDYEGKLTFAKFDVDAGENIPGELGIMSIPTLVLFSKGKEVERFVGALPKDRMKAMIDEMLKKA